MHLTPLPGSSLEVARDGRLEALVVVGDNQLYPARKPRAFKERNNSW